ncbi:MAG: glycosyltransferase family A protein [Gemmiger sp.]|nr:glycosyltransferase family A protein [Gemmiger sp.]
MAELQLPAITVIIPCYKAEKTLRACLASVLWDAPANVEVLLVEDGSPDATGPLCDALAREHPGRVRAFHRPNGGAGAARNTGLDAATGEWVLFVDADDTLLPGLWQALPAAFAGDGGNTPGLVVYGLRRASAGGDIPCPAAPGFYPGPAALGDALAPLLFDTAYLAAPYPKLFRADVLAAGAAGGKAPLRFDTTLAVNEDVLFNIQFLQNLSPIYFLSGVYYYQNDKVWGSLSRRLRGDLLEAEAVTQVALAALCRKLALPAQQTAALLATSHTRACLNQYGLLAGCPGALPLATRRRLFAEILADPTARATLRRRLAADPNRLLALPYRLGVAARLPGWLALYTAFKNHFLA